MMPLRTPRMHPVTVKILEALSDQEWHPEEDIIDFAQYVIPPGEAFRLAQNKSKSDVLLVDRHEMIARGQRARTVQAINSLVSNNRIERKGDSRDDKMLRLISTRSLVYVVRDDDDNIHLSQFGEDGVDVYFVDAQADSDNPNETEYIRQAIQCLPQKMRGGPVEAVLRKRLNRLKVDNLLRIE